VAPKALKGRPAPAGGSGESRACRYLEHRGFTILDRNYRCRSGEVDIVARQGAETVFVEVKERRGASHGEAYEAVTFGKRQRIIRAARLYAAAHGLTETPMRFDVVSIDWEAGRSEPRLRHDAGAFDARGEVG
jgi:putative endonuclease